MPIRFRLNIADGAWDAFPKLRDDNQVVLWEIIEELAKGPAPAEGDRKKLRDFYLTAMDEAHFNAGTKVFGETGRDTYQGPAGVFVQ